MERNNNIEIIGVHSIRIINILTAFPSKSELFTISKSLIVQIIIKNNKIILFVSRIIVINNLKL